MLSITKPKKIIIKPTIRKYFTPCFSINFSSALNLLLVCTPKKAESTLLIILIMAMNK